MICANCGKEIHLNDRYYRAGNNRTLFCSKDCSYEAFEGYYSKQEVEKTLVCHKERYEFKVSFDITNDSIKETGNVSIFDKENEKFVAIIPVQASDREHFMEIAQSIKKAFLRGGTASNK